MSLWFVSAAVLPEMTAEAGLSSARGAALSSAVQIGFVIGALGFAILGLADRFDPRRVFFLSGLVAAAANALLLVTAIGGTEQIVLRVITGAALAGVYPVGMKIAVGWGQKDRGLLVGLLVGALTLGSASPHLFALLGGLDWRVTVGVASLASALGAVLILLTQLGPFHSRAPRFDPGVVAQAWTNRRVRLAYAGYLGHMWELYAFWAWCAAIAAASFTLSGHAAPETAARLTAFLAIALGGLACIPVGALADRIGKARAAQAMMILSGLAGVVAAFSFAGPVWLVASVLVLWGIFIIPDSAQFSALVADAAPPESVGSLMTFQTALGFALTAITVQVTPMAGACLWYRSNATHHSLDRDAKLRRIILQMRSSDTHTASTAEMRPPEQVMRLSRMGCFHQTRLSFMRVLLRRLKAENWQFDCPIWRIDSNGVGVATYRAKGPERTYTLVAFSHDLPAEKRSDRVIAEAWDSTFTLVDGEPTEADLTRLSQNVPVQDPLSRKSLRAFIRACG